MDDWDIIEEVGGGAAMESLMREFYDRLFDDMIIGFLFDHSDKEALIASQIDYIHAHLGSRQGRYEGPSIREAHRDLPILVGQFDRRHQILGEVLQEFEVPERVRQAWLNLDQAMREMVINQGAQRRDEILSGGD